MEIRNPVKQIVNDKFEINPFTEKSVKTIGDLQGVYATDILDHLEDQVAYEVLSDHRATTTEIGTLKYAISTIKPYVINHEFSCTRGHFHANRLYDEYYFGYSGEGYLLFWDGEQECFAEKVFSGSVHYIAGKYAHRLINTSLSEELIVGACLNVLAGYDYETIDRLGFPVRCFLEKGKVVWK